MADYQPLIARAIAGLERNSGENRRALYERARTALVAQLRSVDPPLDESDITRERLALEEAIRKVESESIRPPKAEEPAEASLRDQGLRSFRDTVAEAQSLGGASAEANRSARASYEVAPESGVRNEPDLVQPTIEPPAGIESFHGQEAADGGFETGVPPAPLVREPPFEDPAPFHPQRLKQNSGSAPPPAYDDDEAYGRPAGGFGRVIKIAALLLIVAGLAGAGYWQRDLIAAKLPSIASISAMFRSAPAPASRDTPAPSVAKPKISDRIGSDSAPGTATAPAAAVAQKVVLYDEDTSDPQGKRYVGSAIWRTETVSPGPGLAPELAIRADVEIPERRLRMTWSLRRNTDKALPASHTIEVMFTLPADFAEGGVNNIPGVLMKQNESARGAPLAGLSVKVTNGYFLIGLSSVDADVTRNIQLLKEREWFDIPLVYTSGKRAILAIEKGTPGNRAFEEAFRAWGQ
jgi:hypothetical protein